jgi:hypothetical protein
VRDGAGWLLAGVKLTVIWRAGDPAIMEVARAKGQAMLDAG